MDTQFLSSEAKKLTAIPKGILAIDESIGTCHGRFEKLGVPLTEENRRKYREMLITTPRIEEYISGFILVPETVVQATKEGVLFADILRQKGISIGVTSNTGYELFNEVNGVRQEVTVGLSDLATRMPEYKKLGASFSKWREQVRIGNGAPTDEFLQEGAKRLAEYANICQSNNVVPIVEPEVLIDGDHTIEKCYEVTAHNLGILFATLKEANVYIPGILLKPSMVLSGNTCPVQATTEQIAEMTVKCLKENVPSDIGGIVFLSGGQTEQQATDNLRMMHKMYPELPWAL
ncbi:fructose-bisphosphate aldolase class I, partial [Candidatus Nomurabacteria bacterium]|nr:fructose-bisphosphate aldolase class I [Candidatus Nomurabacteria bacterium]